MQDNVIALFELEQGNEGVQIVAEKHYRLVPPEEVTQADLDAYLKRTAD